MPNQERNGRNVAMPEENRPSWRPQDENQRRMTSSDERGDWDHSIERYGQGQSGYGAGRYEGERGPSDRNERNDRSMQSQGNYGHPGHWTDEDWSSGQSRMSNRNDGQGGYGQPDHRYRNTLGGRAIGEPRYGHAQHGYGQGFGQAGYGGPSAEGFGTGFSDQGSTGYGSGYGHQPEHDMPFRGGQQRMEPRVAPPGLHRGKGPSGYQRSDDRIREMVCDALTDHDHIDATHIDVAVKNGEVTLTGVVDDRRMKRLAEDCIENLSGVKDVVNQLRASDRAAADRQMTASDGSSRNGGSAVDKAGREQDLQSGNHPSDKRHRA